VRRFLFLLLLGGSTLLAVILLEPGSSFRTGSPFYRLCLLLYLLFLGALALSVAFYRRYAVRIQNAWLVVVSSGLSLMVLDAVTHRLRDVNQYARTLPDPIVHHRLWPGTTTWLRSEDFRASLHVNRYGLRGREPEMPKRRDAYRIVMLGDSFTMGEGVSDDQTFSALLERSLSSRLSARIEILNAGVDSYAPILSYLDLRENLLRLEPDAVLLNLDMSDLLQEQYYRSLAVRGPGGEITAVPNPRLSGRLTEWLDDWIRRNLYFLRFVYLHLRQRLDPEESMEAAVQRRNGDLLAYTLNGDDVDRSGEWRDLFDSIVRIRQLCERRGILFFLTVYPWGHQVNGREWVPGRTYWMSNDATASDRVFEKIRQECVENRIALIDTVPAFRTYHGDRLLYFRHDMHWTPEGHRVMSEALLEQILEPIAGDLRLRSEPAPGTP